MATVNVKNFPDGLYEKLRDRARNEHRSISQQIVHILSSLLEQKSDLSIMDLKGLGKDLWRGMDAAEHVRKEREAWDRG